MKNEYEIRGEVTAIFLTKKNSERLEAFIDTDDLVKASAFPHTWFAHSRRRGEVYYVVGNYARSKLVLLHRWITDVERGFVVDHFNGNPLDNRRNNLRICTQAENAQNRTARSTSSSGVRGVHWAARQKKWCAQVQVNNKTICVGYFTDLQQARIAVEAVRAKHMPYSAEAAARQEKERLA